MVYLYVLDMDECRMIQCQNNATCQNLDGSYRCVCREGFEGKYCEKGNYIVTFFLNSHLWLILLSLDWKDSLWNVTVTDIDECLTLSPCLHGGKCINLMGGYRCECPEGWIGKDCNRGRGSRWIIRTFKQDFRLDAAKSYVLII